jgi:hypothetical protein
LDLAPSVQGPSPGLSNDDVVATVALFAGFERPELRHLLECEGFVVLDFEKFPQGLSGNPDLDVIPDAVVIDFRHRQWSWGFGVIKAIRDTYKWDVPVLMLCEALPRAIFRVPAATTILANPFNDEAVRIALSTMIRSQPWAL